MTKKNALVFSGVMMLVAFLSTEELQFCHSAILKECPIPLDDSKEILLYPFFLIFLISLFTLFLKEEVFQTWWRFARWSVPVLMFFTYVLNGSGGGGFGISSSDFILVWLLYIIFVITSFTIIIRATYRAAGQ